MDMEVIIVSINAIIYNNRDDKTEEIKADSESKKQESDNKTESI